MEYMTYQQPLELRGANERTLSGYAARFFDPANPAETETRVAPGVVERLMPGALGSITRDVVALAQHDQAQPLGRRSAGTLQLNVDAVGLRFDIDLPDTTAGRDMRASVERGDVNGASFGFLVRPGGARRRRGPGGLIIRELHDIDLVEVSPVTLPANPTGTSVALRGELAAEDLNDLYRARARDRLRDLALDNLRFADID